MNSPSDEPRHPKQLPDALLETLDDLDPHRLRAVHEYVEERLAYASASLDERIEAGPGEEIVGVFEHDAYTLVSKKVPCGSGCRDCPHGPYLYLVRVETRPNGESTLHWSFIGRTRTDSTES